MKVEQLTITPDENDVRLDRWFARHFPQVNNIRLQKLLRTGQVRVDGKRVDGKTRLSAGQVVRIPPLPVSTDVKEEKKTKATTLSAKQVKSWILYDDDDVVIINKPAGLAVQGGTGIKESLDDVLDVFKIGKEKPKLVHRLDRETSGVLVIARNVFSASKLAEAFRERTTEKYYLAILQACPRPRVGTVDAPLLKTPTGKMVVDKAGDSAVTDYRTLVKAKSGETLTLMQPHTGRTHQLRAHAAHLGCPIIGDPIYNADRAVKGLQLHAARLIIPHPREEYGFLDVAAPLPDAARAVYESVGFDTARDWVDENLEKKR